MSSRKASARLSSRLVGVAGHGRAWFRAAVRPPRHVEPFAQQSIHPRAVGRFFAQRRQRGGRSLPRLAHRATGHQRAPLVDPPLVEVPRAEDLLRLG